MQRVRTDLVGAEDQRKQRAGLPGAGVIFLRRAHTRWAILLSGYNSRGPRPAGSRSCDHEEDLGGRVLAILSGCRSVCLRRCAVALRSVPSRAHPGALGGPTAGAWRREARRFGPSRLGHPGSPRLDWVALSSRPSTASRSISSNVSPDSPPV